MSLVYWIRRKVGEICRLRLQWTWLKILSISSTRSLRHILSDERSKTKLFDFFSLRMIQVYFLKVFSLLFCKFRSWSGTCLWECTRKHDLQTCFTRTSLKNTLFNFMKIKIENSWRTKLECIKCLQSFFGIHASHAPVKDGCAEITTPITRSKMQPLAYTH